MIAVDVDGDGGVAILGEAAVVQHQGVVVGINVEFVVVEKVGIGFFVWCIIDGKGEAFIRQIRRDAFTAAKFQCVVPGAIPFFNFRPFRCGWGFGGVAIDRKLAVFVNGEAQILVALGFD